MATQQSQLAFIKTLSLMALSLVNVDVSKMKAKAAEWYTESTPFAKAFSFTAAWKEEYTLFVKSFEFTEEDARAMHELLKFTMPRFVEDTSIKQPTLAMIKDINLFFKKDSAPAWSRINKNITLLKDPTLAALFLEVEGNESTPDVDSDTEVASQMTAIVKRLTGRNDMFISFAEGRDLREAHQEDMAKYAVLRKKFFTNYKAALLKFVRTSGKEMVPVELAAKYLEGLGYNGIPKGLKGFVDEKGVFFTTAGKQISAIPVGEVVMNPKYDPDKDNTYVATSLMNKIRYRTISFNDANKTERFAKVGDFMDNVDEHRNAWLKDLDSFDEKVKTLAAMVEVLYQTQARVGGENNAAKGESTFGITTIQRRHITSVTAKGVEMDYPGKKGTPQHHLIRANTAVGKKVVAIIKGLLVGKKPDARVFTSYGNKPISAADVNRYLRTKGISVSAHKFRHLAGTKLAKEILSKSPFKKGAGASQAAVEKWVKTELVAVGNMLHHQTGTKPTSSTAIAAYIDPSLIKGFFNRLGLRTPKWVPLKDD